MRRVSLLGSGGSGKSTLARRLGEATGLPVVHLDALYWRPNWTKTPSDEWFETVSEIVSRESWIIDGNYSSGRTLGLRLDRADAVIVMEVPRTKCVWRVLMRAVRRGERPDMAEGCEERLFSMELIKFFAWVWTYPKRRLPAILESIEERPQLRVHRLQSADDIERFMEEVA